MLLSSFLPATAYEILCINGILWTSYFSFMASIYFCIYSFIYDSCFL